MTGTESRRFIRHPSSIPVQIRLLESCGETASSLVNVSYGGLALYHDQAIKPGSNIELVIAAIDPNVELRGVVVWCRSGEDSHELGIKFPADIDVFRMRMVEQLCHIEEYRHKIAEKEGRLLSSEDAAAEWIEKYAGNFPAAG